jgi:hypothetical protein
MAESLACRFGGVQGGLPAVDWCGELPLCNTSESVGTNSEDCHSNNDKQQEGAYSSTICLRSDFHSPSLDVILNSADTYVLCSVL